MINILRIMIYTEFNKNIIRNIMKVQFFYIKLYTIFSYLINVY
jgi:hypothetical protein